MEIVCYNVIGEDTDYGSGPYMITFSANETCVLFDVQINDDNMLEANSENFILTIDPSSLPDYVTVSDPGQATVNIIDDESEIFLVCVIGIRHSKYSKYQ